MSCLMAETEAQTADQGDMAVTPSPVPATGQAGAAGGRHTSCCLSILFLQGWWSPVGAVTALVI